MYRHVNTAKLEGTSKQGELSAVPSRLVKMFGPPTDESWDSESLGAFYFLSPNDKVFAVYHRAYDTPRTQRLKKSFWSGSTVTQFSIGSLDKSGVDEFKAWLLLQLA